MQIYTIQDHPNLLAPGSRPVFEAFRKAVLALDPCVTEEFLKLYVAYKAETNFVDVVPQAKRLRLSLNMRFADVNDPKGLCKDVTGIGRWGNGDVEIGLSTLDELPYVIGLVRQSLEVQLGRGSRRMNEAETRAEHIDPALKAAGWGVVEGSRIRREYPITLGRIEGHGKRGKALTADYVLEYRNTKLAVVEAKAWDKPLTEGVGQAKDYAGKLAIRFTYATNGQGIYGIDMETGHGRRAAAVPDAGGTLEPDLCRAERLARPLRRRALRGQGRLLPEPLLSGHRHRAGAGGHRRRASSASC